MLLLGLNAYHGDSAACLVRDGQLVAAAEEERFRRVKHWAGLPTQAIRFCLAEAGVSLGDIDHVAINRKPGVNNARRAAFLLTHCPDPRLVWQKIANRRKVASIEDSLAAAFPNEQLRAPVHQIEHHLAHLASAFLVSSFDEAVCVSVDGFGDFASAAWGMGQGNEIQIDGRVYFPHSLGIFYSAITQLLGFPHYGDEYKVMGLAPYGEPKFMKEMRELVHVKTDGTYELNLGFFRHHNENVSYSWNDCSPEVGTLYTPALEDLLGPTRKKDEPLEQRHKDLARSAQAMYEEAFFALLNALHDKYRCPNLSLSGGCAMNSVANGKVYLKTPFRRMYLPAAAGDAGGAIGSAYVVWHQFQRAKDGGQKTEDGGRKTEDGRRRTEDRLPTSDLRPLMSDVRPPTSDLRTSISHLPYPYAGPQFSDAEIECVLRSRGLLRAGSAVHPPMSDLCPPPSVLCLPTSSALAYATAQAIAYGKVVGWFQGRMEWGPRALGNRSILCDPRRADMKQVLNDKIKRRESFRPFAPSILREHVAEWFEQDDDVPFMMQVFQIRAEKRSLIPAVCHVDGSGRLQTVHRDTNPRYHELISAFCRLTSIPLVLNTSFNENEPVVCRPEEALDCFLRTKMDVLVMGNWRIDR